MVPVVFQGAEYIINMLVKNFPTVEVFFAKGRVTTAHWPFPYTTWRGDKEPKKLQTLHVPTFSPTLLIQEQYAFNFNYILELVS